MTSRIGILLVAMLFLGKAALGHVSLGFPVDGETLRAGQEVSIEWRLDIPHNQLNWDVYFSADGGTVWIPLQLNLPISQLSLHWIVSTSLTGHGRIRIVQDNVDGDYEAESADFVIVATSTGAEASRTTVATGMRLNSYPNPFTAAVAVEFVLDEPGSVRLTVVDLQGRLVDTLLNGYSSAGNQRLNWAAGTLPIGLYVLRLEYGRGMVSRGVALV